MTSSGKKTSQRSLNRLVGQLRWVTRIATALTASIRPEDLYSIILSAVVSPDGLDYSKAFLFATDRTQALLQGKLAMGPASRREALALRRELKAEADYLASLKQPEAGAAAAAGAACPPPANSADAESAAKESATAPACPPEALRFLEDSAHWISIAQRMEVNGLASQALAEIRTSLSGPDSGAPASDDFLRWAASLTFPTVIDPSRGSPLPSPPLDKLLLPPIVAVPLRTPKGLRGLILADKRFSRNRDIDPGDLQEFDWFSLQAALAIENADLIEDLEVTYNQLQELDTLKGNFLSIISHELRTPMTAILGVTELLLNERVGSLQPTQRSLLVRAQKNANHLTQIVNDLIEVTEVQAEGMRNLALRPVDPLAILFNTLPKLEQRRRDQNVDVEPIVLDTVPRILGDSRSLERILFHLLDNAIKFSERGKRVEVDFRRNQDRLQITVRDHGIGIPPDRLQRIFDSFYQVDNRLSRSYEGLGLGLTVIRLLIAATHGEISVQSKVGEGSAFTISYPIILSSENH